MAGALAGGALILMTAPDLDLDRVPSALRDRAQWLVWRFEEQPGDKKPRKVPYYAGGSRRLGKQGSDEDRAHLVPFERAVAAMQAKSMSGVGFAFLPGDGLIGIDLDGVIDLETGEVQGRAAGIIKACASFTELSPSGKGVHIYVLGETKSNKSNDIGVEMFCGRQFFTVTGRQFPGSTAEVMPIRGDVLERLHAVIDEAKGVRPPAGSAPVRQPNVGGGASLEGQSFFAKVNAKALHNLPAWVPSLFPSARTYNDGYRVTSADLGRDLEEDLSIVPQGIKDWGEERGKTAIDLVLEWGGASDAVGAAEWLCARMGIRPDALGGRLPRRIAPPSSPVAPSGAESGVEATSAPHEPPDWVMDGPPPDALMDAVHGAADWLSEFRRTPKGVITPTLYNTLHVLENDPEWHGVLAFDQFSYRITKRKKPPITTAGTGEWVDIDDIGLQVYLTKTYGFEAKKPTVMDAVMNVAHAHSFHPVREWLDGLQHDGTPRLHKLLGEYFGCASTPGSAPLRKEDPGAYLRLMHYLELASVKWLVGAVARVMRPGCKLDTMVVLEGGQGVFKSTAFRVLFGDEWFSDSKLTIGDKDALAQMQGKWCYEMAEMDAHRKADDTAFKQFLSSQVDRVRWHYGRRAEDVPRQSIFVGTTNMDQYGKDETGMRRVWPAFAGKVLITALSRDRDQLFAEAVAMYRAGVPWWVSRDVFVLEPDNHPELDRPWSEWDLFDEQGEQRQTQDAWEAPIAEWIEKNNALPFITTAQVMGEGLKLDMARWTPPEQKRVNAILKKMGWRSKKVGPKHARRAGWVRSDADESEQVAADDLPI